MVKGLVIGAPRSGSGKTIVTLGLLAALNQRGTDVAPAKTGPDYIDPILLARAAQRQAINLDPWAMSGHRLQYLAANVDTNYLLIEGVMGLFDGAADGAGSTGDLAELLELPVVLVVDADKQSQSIAPLVAGFANWRFGVQIAGVVLNRVASTRHEKMLSEALSATGIPCLGAIPRNEQLVLPERHLGLVLPAEIDVFDHFLAQAAEAMGNYIDLPQLLELARPIQNESDVARLAPLGQRIAIARDDAFAFLYPHLLDGWRAAGAELSFFSPLADEAPDAGVDAIYLPGGYPELHGAGIAAAAKFKAGLKAAQQRNALIYGECGGFMVMGEVLLDKTGIPHEMTGLLPVVTQIDRPKRILGYRRLAHQSALPWPQLLAGHEFHYSSAKQSRLPPLFHANDARGEALPPMGAAIGRTMGSYAHVIDVGTP
ncbi:cobyrinate a,c-diamide synthase [Devosia algicola]|uniref:Hydrogenobyrinate a,c-diamide synthase n=1 Tax=Devosia algicola TaxID=3026418 RepID=A0ABY7YMN6_9HYPH|nr:cobyrinate a,c-diamide synthase [Devosia algicola]WDR02479.1 cobyrinate a,c-diamide synthase [Devosia algicola]